MEYHSSIMKGSYEHVIKEKLQCLHVVNLACGMMPHFHATLTSGLHIIGPCEVRNAKRVRLPVCKYSSPVFSCPAA